VTEDLTLQSVGPAVDVVEESAKFALALLRTRKPIEPECLDALFRVTTELMGTYGPRVLYVVVPGAREPSVSPQARQQIEKVWPKIQAQSLAGVVWIRSAGFAGALNRKQLTELLPNLRYRSLLGVTQSAGETAEFFCRQVPELDIDAQAWAAAFEQFAAAYD
jgi:hypothetical protein